MKKRIKKDEAGTRLDKFLVANIKDKTRSFLQKMIETDSVCVNGVPAKGNYRVKESDLVELCVADYEAQIGKKKNKADIKKEDKLSPELEKKIEIVEETDEYLVINKPAGLVVHGAAHITEASLADWLLEKYPKLKGIGEDPARPGIVHRLDKEASGLMVVARTQKSFNELKKQFQKRTVEKRYKALVYGQVAKDEEQIGFPIKRSSAGNKQAAVPENFSGRGGAREALTFFTVEKRFINYTLLDVSIKTGRKHQIRVHLGAYGHPIVGDSLYNTKKTKDLDKKLAVGRIFLVAYQLSFNDLSGDRKKFKIGLPKELSAILKTVK